MFSLNVFSNTNLLFRHCKGNLISYNNPLTISLSMSSVSLIFKTLFSKYKILTFIKP